MCTVLGQLPESENGEEIGMGENHVSTNGGCGLLHVSKDVRGFSPPFAKLPGSICELGAV